MNAIITETRDVRPVSLGLFCLGALFLTAWLVRLYVPQLGVNPEHLLSASMLLGLAGVATHALTRPRQITVLEMAADRMRFRSHKNPINGIAFCSTYDRPKELLLADIRSIRITTIDVPRSGSFSLILLTTDHDPTETAIWLRSSLQASVRSFLATVQRRVPSADLTVDSPGPRQNTSPRGP